MPKNMVSHDDEGFTGKSSFFVEAQESFQEKQEYSWQELQRIELDRRAILKRVELPFWKILSYWNGTCLGVLSRDSLLWLSITLYIVIRLQVHFGFIPIYVQQIGQSTNIDVLGGFLSFFLVLFVNQSNSRFHESYKQTTECTRRIGDTAGLAATTLPKAHAVRLVRYLNAAHVAGYVGLSHTYTKRTFFDELNRTLGLLTADEMAHIERCDMDHRGDCFREIVNWALMEVQVAEKGSNATTSAEAATPPLIDGRLAGMFREKILAFRSAMDNIYDYNDQPIHFFYIHFLCLLTSVYVPIFAISSAYSAGIGNETHWSTDILSGVIVLMQAIFVIGLRLLGQKMMDPFGDDVEDLSVLKYVRDAWKTSNRMLSTHFPAPVSPTTEEGIQYMSSSLGHPWDLRRRQQSPSRGNSSGNISVTSSGTGTGAASRSSSFAPSSISMV